MLKYFIIFTSIGLLIGRLERMDARLFYIALISLGWATYTEFIWGLAAMGELFLGAFISRAIWPPSDTRRQTDGTQHGPQIPSAGLPSLTVFRANTLSVLDREMNYSVDIPGPMQETFNKATRGALENGLNEYDAAIAFMLILLKRMDRPVSKENLESYLEKLRECMKLTPLSTHAFEFLRIYVVDHRSDFSPDLLERPELSFVSKILNEDDRPSIAISSESSTLRTRLSELRNLRETGLISQAQYDLKSSEILRNL
jgi:hypothetical protein